MTLLEYFKYPSFSKYLCKDLAKNIVSSEIFLEGKLNLDMITEGLHKVYIKQMLNKL